MGYPTDYFTVLFALGRLPGWIAQWEEMLADPEQKIARPRQIYTGEGERAVRAALARLTPATARLQLGGSPDQTSEDAPMASTSR